MSIVVQCQSCKKKIKAGEKYAGKRVKCPGCQTVLSIPAAEPPAGIAPTASSGPQKPATPAPVAANLFDDEIPVRQEKPPAQSAAGSVSDILDDGIPVRPEPKRAQSATQSPGNCPECGVAVSAEAVLCVNCGYDFRTHSKRSTQAGLDATSGGTKKKRKKKRRSSEEATRFNPLLRGCGISAISVFIGMVIWYGIAMLTGFELGVIAWMLGGAAGVGMAAGCGENGTNGLTGLLAAIITFFGIFFARLAIVLTIILPLLAGANAPDEFFDDEFAIEEEFAGEMESDDMEAEEELDEDAETAGEPTGDMEMPLDEASADEEFQFDEMPEVEIGLGDVIAGLVVFSGMLMFGSVWQTVFVVLACATAFRVGITGVVDED